jgi:hypothetical protein
MTFFVEKRLAVGRIRFSVAPHDAAATADGDVALSTGPNGEFVRRHSEGYFLGDAPRFDGTAPPLESNNIARVPFWVALKPEGTAASWAIVALLPLGLLFVLLGLAALVKSPVGLVYILFGLVLIAIPIIRTAQRRKKIREEEARQRAEAAAAEQRNRDMLGTYLTALENLRTDRSDAAIARIERERGALELPYEVWAPVARSIILQIGFDELASGNHSTAEIGRLLDRATKAAGLSREDAVGIKQDLYQTVLWHYVADRRLGDAQEKILEQIENDFRLPEMPLDSASAEQFRRIRNASAKKLDRIECGNQLGMHEFCVFESGTNGTKIHVTNKRLLVEGDEAAEVPLPKIYDIAVNVDAGTATIKSTDRKKPLSLHVPDPIYTAAVLDLASELDQRPKSWA